MREREKQQEEAAQIEKERQRTLLGDMKTNAEETLFVMQLSQEQRKVYYQLKREQ